MNYVTEQMFYKQLTGNAAGAITATIIGAAILGFCAGFCGTQLGWGHLLSIVFIVLFLACMGLLVFFIVKAARMKQHPVFRRYGSAPFLAERINSGMQNPRYIFGTGGEIPFATLITNDFIVSSGELTGFMELKDLRTAQIAVFGNTHVYNISNPVTLAASAAANYAADKYMESKGINEQTRCDMLIMKDSEGKQHQYSVRHIEAEAVLNLLQQIAPHITINRDVKRM